MQHGACHIDCTPLGDQNKACCMASDLEQGIPDTYLAHTRAQAGTGKSVNQLHVAHAQLVKPGHMHRNHLLSLQHLESHLPG